MDKVNYYKVKLRLAKSTRELWVAIKAHSVGEAVVITDNRTMDTLFRICCNSITEISKKEYNSILSRAGVAHKSQEALPTMPDYWRLLQRK